MTDDRIALRALLEKGSDTSFLREMISFAAERLMALETETLCGAAPGERTPPERINQRNGHRERDWHTRAGTVELRIAETSAANLQRRDHGVLVEGARGAAGADGKSAARFLRRNRSVAGRLIDPGVNLLRIIRRTRR